MTEEVSLYNKIIAFKDIIENIDTEENKLKLVLSDAKELITRHDDQINQKLLDYLTIKSLNKSIVNRDAYVTFYTLAVKRDAKFYDNLKNLETSKKIILDEDLDFGSRGTALQYLTRYFSDNNLFLKNEDFREALPKIENPKGKEGLFMMFVKDYEKKYIRAYNEKINQDNLRRAQKKER